MSIISSPHLVCGKIYSFIYIVFLWIIEGNTLKTMGNDCRWKPSICITIWDVCLLPAARADKGRSCKKALFQIVVMKDDIFLLELQSRTRQGPRPNGWRLKREGDMDTIVVYFACYKMNETFNEVQPETGVLPNSFSELQLELRFVLRIQKRVSIETRVASIVYGSAHVYRVLCQSQWATPTLLCSFPPFAAQNRAWPKANQGNISGFPGSNWTGLL